MFSKNLVATQTTTSGTITIEPNACASDNIYPFTLNIDSGSNNDQVVFLYSPY
jgi:hypothetical protein